MAEETQALSFGAAAGEVGIVMALIAVNAFFVAAEFALVSVRKTRIDQLAAEGSASAGAVKRALRELDRHIAAAQVGITVVSLLIGAKGERTFHHIFEPLLIQAGLPKEGQPLAAGFVALVLAYFIMTALHVIIGEQLPKTIAIQKADVSAMLIVRPMMWFTWICTPLVWMLNHSVNFLLKLLGLHVAEGHSQVHSPEELDLLFAQSHDAGELTKTEFEILHRVVRFSDLTAREIMVPRVEMKALPVSMTRAELIAYINDEPHTRVAVYHGSLDEIIGIAHLKDLLKLAGLTTPQEGEAALNLMPIVRDAPRVPETITIDRLLVDFKKRRQQMAIVIDEFGGTSGIVTMGDLLEQAFGDVHDEFDHPEPEIVKQPDGTILLNGRLLIEEVNERFGTGFPTDEADTIAGLVLNELGRSATPGDAVEIGGTKLYVEKVERQRITSIRLELAAENREDNVGELHQS
ncbi:MAG TPA: hemolysin family protein [Abditibacteriaceae bacterium]|jgi:CBS domain containing-hemolysin-like protein